MSLKTTFKRYELKYLMTREQMKKLEALVQIHMNPDQYGENRIYNLYYDTDDFLLIRRSLERGVYKEKLRLRSYGRAQSDKDVYLEIKKKYKGVVYKRRIELKENDAKNYFTGDYELPTTQIAKEINYFKSLYQTIEPRVLIAYDRKAFFGKENEDFRVTFDENITWRTDELSLCSKERGKALLDSNQILMEIKVANAIPLWLTHFLTENKIYKTPYSKYGTAYQQLLLTRKENKYAA